MVALLLLTMLQGAAVTPPASRPAAPAQARPRVAANLSLWLFVTDNDGRNLEGVTVTLTGPVDRELKTPGDTGLRFTNLRAGTYRARFAREEFHTFEKEIILRAGTTPEIAVTLTAAPPPPPPPAPEPPSPPLVPTPPAAWHTQDAVAARLHRKELHLQSRAAEGEPRRLQRCEPGRTVAGTRPVGRAAARISGRHALRRRWRRLAQN